MKILITDGADIINQDHIKRIQLMPMDYFLAIVYNLTSENKENDIVDTLWDTFHINENVNITFAEELLREILINECTKDVIDMKEVKNIYKHRERLELAKN